MDVSFDPTAELYRRLVETMSDGLGVRDEDLVPTSYEALLAP